MTVTILTIYAIFLVGFSLFSFFALYQLFHFGYVGDASRRMMILYITIALAIILGSILALVGLH